MRGVLGALAAVWAILGGVCLLAIIAVTMTNVGAFALDRLARPLGGAVGGLPGYEDFVQMIVGVAALSFLPWCQHRGGHIAVDLFVSGLPTGAQRGLDRLWLALTAALGAFLALTMTQGMVEARADGALTPVLGWPVWPFQAPGAVSLALWAAVAAAQATAGDAAERADG